ncbi:MAG: ATP-grasp domain-containing protein, partial [Gemmatimonadaceae bacterium]|nr:ATP-grasp domain-containing protein [Gloeobacterales cyanobacterium ES-bin-141]
MHTLIFAIDTNRLGISRLPKVLQAAGFKVGTLCSPKSVLTKTRYIDRRYALTSLKSSDYLLKSLIKAIRDWHPEILISGDEIAVAFLHSVVRRAASQPDTVPKEVLKVVCNSLGSPEYFAATLFKHVTQQLAAELGIRTPVQQTIASTEAALDFARQQGYPVVLKSDFSWSGTGVKICRDERQLVEALPALLPPKTHPL